jgi:hypothetical protein
MLRIESPFQTADIFGQTPIESVPATMQRGIVLVRVEAVAMSRRRADKSARENVKGSVDGRACLIERQFHMEANMPAMR